MVMCQSKHVLDGLVEAWQGCQSHQDCTQVTLGDFTESSASYVHTWQEISSFAGIDMGEVNHTCLMRQDVHSPTFKPDHHDHRSTIDASEAYRAHVRATAMALDAELFGGYYQQAKDAMAM